MRVLIATVLAVADETPERKEIASFLWLMPFMKRSCHSDKDANVLLPPTPISTG